MVVAGGDYVHFVVEYGGKIEKCRVTETALLNRERMSRKLAKADFSPLVGDALKLSLSPEVRFKLRKDPKHVEEALSRGQ